MKKLRIRIKIYPLSYRKKEEKEERIRKAVSLAVQIQNRSQQIFALAGILAFTDKIIDMETANKIRRAIEMTQVAMLFEEEKQKAVEEERERAAASRQKAVEEERERAAVSRQKAVERERKRAAASEQQIVIKMIEKGLSTDEIVFLVSNFSRDDVEALRKDVAVKL